MDNSFEKQYREQGYIYIAGVDEAGRGPLAGPLVVAAVILPPKYVNELIDDSKKLNSTKRELLFEQIIDNALSYNIQIIDPETIDKMNIYAATQMGMSLTVNNLNHPFDIVLTDAMKLNGISTRVDPIIKGDAKSQTIAAASILAKVTRDRILLELDKVYPNYGFASHKGYGTKKHLEALAKWGPIKGVHRFSYQPVIDVENEQIKLF